MENDTDARIAVEVKINLVPLPAVYIPTDTLRSLSRLAANNGCSLKTMILADLLTLVDENTRALPTETKSVEKASFKSKLSFADWVVSVAPSVIYPQVSVNDIVEHYINDNRGYFSEYDYRNNPQFIGKIIDDAVAGRYTTDRDGNKVLSLPWTRFTGYAADRGVDKYLLESWAKAHGGTFTNVRLAPGYLPSYSMVLPVNDEQEGKKL
jgi:hypothetical protein